MTLSLQAPTLWLIVGVLTLLGIATGVGQFLKLRPESGLNASVLRSFNLRIQSWWLMTSVVVASMLLPQWATVLLFGLISFWALREFITLTPTRMADHRALFWVFFLFTPLQYVLVGLQRYELFSIMIPVYCSLFIPARIAMAGDYKRFLERSAKIQFGAMVCVYCLSYSPALLSLHIPGHENQQAALLFFFVLMVQVGDVMQYLFNRSIGRRVIAPAISRYKTWEGFGAGAGATALLGAALWWATPFETPWKAAFLALVISIMGYAGSLTMSAIKRDRGVTDYGTLVEGHGGVLDRIDSICFAAPVFYHVVQLVYIGV